ncbi:ATP-binding protein [Magnetospirillum aberrantis]|uniref:AAA family ATPase n=1 Tax=Magnetospirillum aberrantis SpK TaxID=908842 RepID=A0A7C9QVJ8_9PROT|nr:ATP-binding protein [Magnetospirillum aberrantis]NFV80376.1 AAA family ATPase [Magnetospirillum aberrantis SpK]
MTTNEPQDQQLPEYSGNPFIASLPPILSMAEALKALNAPPAFHERERSFPDELRVHCIQRLNNYFLPLEQHLKLEMALSVLIRQGYVSRNPLDKTYFQRLQDGHDRIVHKDLLLGRQRSPSTASSMALVGCSGMGKSRTVERLLNLYPKIIYHEEPYSFYQIVWLKLDCPLQGSPKQLCISFFQAIDNLLGTDYIREFAGPRRGLDEMIRHMYQVANLHAIGVLVIDEIQHLNQTRGAGPDLLLNFLVTLVNTIGIPVLTVGTHGAMAVLQGNFRQARRASGLGSHVWNNLKPDRTWDHFVDAMWRYQWTQEFTPLTDDLRQVLYEESQGIIDVVVKLFMLAQLRAIRLRAVRRRPERLDRELLLQVVAQDFKLIAPMLNALKRGDERALAKYDDLRPLQKHVQQVFADYAPPMPASEEPPAAEAPQVSPRQALAAMGIADDLVEVLLARAQQDGADEFDLLGAALAQLKAGKKSAMPKRKKVNKPEVDPHSVHGIVQASLAAERSPYEALKEAGYVRDPLQDLAG